MLAGGYVGEAGDVKPFKASAREIVWIACGTASGDRNIRAQTGRAGTNDAQTCRVEAAGGHGIGQACVVAADGGNLPAAESLAD